MSARSASETSQTAAETNVEDGISDFPPPLAIPKGVQVCSKMLWRVGIRRDSSAWALTQTPTTLRELGILTGSLLFIHHHSSDRLSQFQLGAHLFNLRGLALYYCRETRNRTFQVRDPLLLLLKFIEARMRLGALGSAHSYLPTGTDKGRA